MDGSTLERPLVPAAQYLRMSTEHQRYSMENQAAAIGVYALTRGFEVVRTYQDAARSGLTLKGRSGLQSLLADVVGGTADFNAILVLDVSRWGRFQDPDQAAHYEFLCREAGLDLRYCGEPWENDGSPASTILKHLKRVMAGEYSRELSEKLRRAKRHKAELGMHNGPTVAFGLRRQVVTKEGTIRVVLEPGERKAIHTDNIRLIHGPEDEVATVREIFRLFANRQMGQTAIARELIRQGRPHPPTGPWNQGRVRQILDNEIYTGRVFYGKTSQYLKSNKRNVPREEWIEVTTFPPIVSERTYRKARARVKDRPIFLSNDEVLARLKRCLREQGRLNAPVISATPYLPSQQAIRARFGKLSRAYELIGYTPAPEHWHWRARNARREEDVLAGLQRLHALHGYLTGDLIAANPDLPSLNYLRLHFGSLKAAYERIGIHMTRGELNSAAAHRAGRGIAQPPPPMPKKKPLRKNARGKRFTLKELTTMLRRLLRKHGYLNERLIQSDPSIPTFAYYRRRFGSIFAAYASAGYHSNWSDICRASQERVNGVAKRNWITTH